MVGEEEVHLTLAQGLMDIVVEKKGRQWVSRTCHLNRDVQWIQQGELIYVGNCLQGWRVMNEPTKWNGERIFAKQEEQEWPQRQVSSNNRETNWLLIPWNLPLWFRFRWLFWVFSERCAFLREQSGSDVLCPWMEVMYGKWRFGNIDNISSNHPKEFVLHRCFLGTHRHKVDRWNQSEHNDLRLGTNHPWCLNWHFADFLHCTRQLHEFLHSCKTNSSKIGVSGSRTNRFFFWEGCNLSGFSIVHSLNRPVCCALWNSDSLKRCGELRESRVSAILTPFVRSRKRCAHSVSKGDATSFDSPGLQCCGGDQACLWPAKP